DFLRKSDVWSRTASVDLLNRSLLADFLPAQLARSAGLYVLSAVPPLRQFAMREGVQPMRGIKALFAG
ncbi:MAG: UbiH/UbiF family hydroxylase, partial [Martelella sp.]